MPRRRQPRQQGGGGDGLNWGAALSAVGDAFGAYAQRKRDEEDEMRKATAAETVAKATEERRFKNELRIKAYNDPKIAARLLAAGQGIQGAPLPSEADMLAPAQKSIAGAKTLAELPTQESVFGARQAEGAFGWPIDPNSPQAAGNASLSGITQLMAQRKAQEAALLAEDRASNTIEIPFFDPLDQTMKKKWIAKRDIEGLGGVAQGPTPRVAGEMDVTKARFGEQSPEMGQLKISAGNMLEQGLRTQKLRTAAGQASATAGGSFDALHTPGRMDVAVDLEARLAVARAKSATTHQTPTEMERRAAGNMVPLIHADTTLREFEGRGVGLRGGIQMVVANPALMNTVGKRFSADDLSYVQAANEWTNLAGYVISGVQVRADERGNFMAAMVTNTKDPKLVKEQKQQARISFLQALQLAAGRSQADAGVALGQAIKAGKIPVSVLQSLSLSDDVRTGIEAGLKGLQ